ncbi:apelin receptor B-like [Chelonoidis abingdonii]|uniref:apelin receptor B-like n=1 Tax=Chelonoidis abingdonii TaxID=106734 RepID=UPI003F4997D7
MEDAATDPLGGESYYYYGEANESRRGMHCEWPVDWEVSFSLLPVLHMLVFMLGLLGNGLVIFTMWRGWRAKHYSADTYIGNLALADLAFLVTLPLWPAHTALYFHWLFGSALCKLSSYLVLLTSVFCLGCLSFEHYLAIMRSLPHSWQVYPHASVLLLLAMFWLLASLLALPTLLLHDTQPSPADNWNLPPEMCCPKHVLALLVPKPVLIILHL